MFLPNEPWKPTLDWSTQAGRALRRVIALLPRDRPWLIKVFGSAPLQMGLERDFRSADVDIFTNDDWREVVVAAIAAAGLAKSGTEFYVQCTPEGAFRTSPRWRDRAHREERDGITFRFAHPIDILISKVNRLAEKDLNAFKLVIEKTGHPTEAELIREFQAAPDLFFIGFYNPFAGGSYWGRTEQLWQDLWGRTVDVQREILDPAYARLTKCRTGRRT